MPRKSRTGRAAYQREYRARQRAERKPMLPGMAPGPGLPADPAQAIADWSTECLIVPPGHHRSGSPMTLPDYGVDFLRDVFTHRESILCLARKNAKSAIVAVLLLAHLVGPVRRLGFRAGVVSINKSKANELKMQMQAISEASKLRNIVFRRSPSPGRVESPFGSVDILSSESDAGAAAGFDLSLIDEIGLLTERDRDLVNGMRSAISARNGRFVSISVHGSGPFIPEIIARRGDKALAIHLYQASEKSDLGDLEAWRASNPGLCTHAVERPCKDGDPECGIKFIEYMRDEARRVSVTTFDQPSFLALDLNRPATPGTISLVPLDEWIACVSEDPPELEGDVFIGIDAGGTRAMSAVAAYAPKTGRLRCWACFPKIPDLRKREKVDGAPYVMMQKRGELHLFGNRTSSLKELLEKVADDLGPDVKIRMGAADLFRQGEVADAINDAGLSVKMEWRRSGLGAHGVEDVSSFQKSVLDRKLKSTLSLLLESAIKESIVRLDGNGNQALDRRKANSRIDVLSASILAVGLGARRAAKPKRRRQVISISLAELETMSA